LRRKIKPKQEYVPKIKTICPKCNQETYVILVDNKENKKKDGIVFTYKCLGCNDKFQHERRYTDF